MVEELKKRFESPPETLDKIPESPVGHPLKLFPGHINGLSSSDLTRMPSKRKNSKNHEEGDVVVTESKNLPNMPNLEKSNNDMREKLEELEKEMALLRQQVKEGRKREKRLQHKVNRYENATKARRAQGSLKKWSSLQPSVPELHQSTVLEDLADAQELIQQFVESERLYKNVLEAIHHFFYQPIKTMAVFKKDVISTQQIQAIFLNSPEILALHRLLYDQLYHLRFLPKDSRVEEFLVILERTAPSFSLYSGFQSEFFMQNLQRELSQWRTKPQISMLLNHLEARTEGKSLADLMRVPAGRLLEYSNLLKPFLEDRIKGTRYVNDAVIKRIQGLHSYITSLQVELLNEKGEWESIAEKHKVFMKMSADGPIPLEMFNPDTKLVKQGPVIVTEKGKEIQKTCFLFTTHIALADKTQNHHIMFPENAMISLVGATLYENVDMGGQIIQADIKSGLEQDMLGFRINFTGEHLVLRVGRPNEKKQWVEHIHKTLEAININESDLDLENIIPDVPKIAAASLEKLFQHLTNPQHEDFIDVFLNTYPSFTTPKDVLTALLNCIDDPKEKTPDPTCAIQTGPNHVFTFNMEDNMDAISCNTSISATSQNYSDSGSDSDSPVDSPDTPRRQIPAPSLSGSVVTPTRENPRPVHEVINRASISTDSDSSPYTSGVPIAVDTKREAENGWQEPDQALVPSSVPTKTLEGTFLPFHRPVSRESGNYGDTEEEDFPPMSLPVGHSFSMSQPEPSIDSMFDDTLQRLRKSEDLTPLDKIVMSPPPPRCLTPQDSYTRITKDLDGAQEIVSSMIFSLQEPSPPREPIKESPQEEDEDEVYDAVEDEDNYQKYTGKVRARHNSVHPTSERLSNASNLSFSEPDLVALSVKPRGREPNKSITTTTTPSRGTGTLERSPGVEDELLCSLPATIARKFADPSPTHLQAPSPRRTGRFSLGFNKKKTGDKQSRGKSASVSNQLHPSSSLYFMSPEPQRKAFTSPAKGLGGLFKKKERGKLNKSLSSNFTDGGGGPVVPETPRKSSKVRRNTSLGPTSRLPPRYSNIDDLISSPIRSRGDRSDDASPSNKRKLSSKNLMLAKKIFRVLMKWIEVHFEDFKEPEVTGLLEEFLQKTIESDTEESQLAIDTLEVLSFYQNTFKHDNNSFGNLLARVTTLDVTILEEIDWERPAKVIVDKELDLCSKTSRESGFLKTISEQITLILFAHYNAILRSELLNCNWKKKDKDRLAPNVCRMIKFTNEMSLWICTEVLRRDTVANRALVIEHFVCIAWHCFKHHDMHSVMTITLALSSSCIKRLSKTWDAVERKSRQRYEKLKDITDLHEKCKKLRERLEEITAAELEKTGDLPSALPYVGACLEQIYCLDIGVKTYNSDGLVNFAKMTKLSSMIDGVLQYQRMPYDFAPRLDIIAYITSVKSSSDNELYDMSVAKEPSKR